MIAQPLPLMIQKNAIIKNTIQKNLMTKIIKGVQLSNSISNNGCNINSPIISKINSIGSAIKSFNIICRRIDLKLNNFFIDRFRRGDEDKNLRRDGASQHLYFTADVFSLWNIF